MRKHFQLLNWNMTATFGSNPLKTLPWSRESEVYIGDAES